MLSAFLHLCSAPASSSEPHFERPKGSSQEDRSDPICRGLKELVEVELPRPKLAPEVSAAEEAAFRMTSMWMELPFVSPDGAAGLRPGELLAIWRRT